MEIRSRKPQSESQQVPSDGTKEGDKGPSLTLSTFEQMMNANTEPPLILGLLIISYTIISTISGLNILGAQYLEPIYGAVIPSEVGFFQNQHLIIRIFCVFLGSVLSSHYFDLIFVRLCSLKNLDLVNKLKKQTDQLQQQQNPEGSKSNKKAGGDTGDSIGTQDSKTTSDLIINITRENNWYPHKLDTDILYAISLVFDLIGVFLVSTPNLLSATLFTPENNTYLGPYYGPLLVHIFFDYPVYLFLGGGVTMICAKAISLKANNGLMGFGYLFAIFMATMIFYNAVLSGSSMLDTLVYLTSGSAAMVASRILGHKRFSACSSILFYAIHLGLGSIILKGLSFYQLNIDKTRFERRISELSSPSAQHQHDQNQEQQEQPTVDLNDAKRKRLAARAKSKFKSFRTFFSISPFVFVLFIAYNTIYRNPQCSSILTWKHNEHSETNGFTLISRVESISGWVIVADFFKNIKNKDNDTNKIKFRVLRAGHSIIGGVWNSTGESIYGNFYYLDAVRYVKPPTPRKFEAALQLGLGIGVSAKSLHQQNVVVDVVEYDAAVVHSALNYFDLPNDLNAIHISDGRHFIFNTTSTYDYVIHDIFSNGFISPHLFSVQVLQQIKRILRPDGVFAMNFVAFNDDKHTLCSIKNTLLTAFKNVRLYTESLDKGDSKEQKTVKNIVFFASDLPVKFDFPQEVLAGHSIRSRMLQSLAKNELLLDGCTAGPTGSSDNSVGAVINDGDFGVFNKYTVDVAVNHWYIMRNVFPTEFWMDY